MKHEVISKDEKLQSNEITMDGKVFTIVEKLVKKYMKLRRTKIVG